MHELRILQYTCRGYKSCGLCEDALPGFISGHHGELLISPTNLTKNIEAITEALNSCPTESLVLEEIA